MRNQHHQEAEEIIELQLWTQAEAGKALPYLRSIVRSLREHWLEWRRVGLQVRRLDARPARPDRQALILRAQAAREADLAECHFNDTLDELEALSVYCLDPAGGVALLPFRQGDGLAWFVFDLFAPRGLDGWQFHADPPQTRRALVEKIDPVLVDRVFAQGLDFGKGPTTGQRTNLE
jgi:hypothetical protein